MIRALFSAASGMVAQQLNIDNIANNLANANTTGFKHRRVLFQDLLYQNLIAPGNSAGQQTVFPTGLQLGLGTRVVSNEVIFKQGDFVSTGNPLDIVIEGAGFFQVRLPSGELAYTRAGSFQLDRDGNLVDRLRGRFHIGDTAGGVGVFPVDGLRGLGIGVDVTA